MRGKKKTEKRIEYIKRKKKKRKKGKKRNYRAAFPEKTTNKKKRKWKKENPKSGIDPFAKRSLPPEHTDR